MARNLKRRTTGDEEADRDQEMWLAIRYLDPDKDNKASDIAWVILSALFAVVCGVWIWFHLPEF